MVYRHAPIQWGVCSRGHGACFAGKQDQSRADFANSISDAAGFLYTTRVIGYEGTEQYCEASGKCRSRDTALHATTGYDNMTGLGSPGPGLVGALSGH